MANQMGRDGEYPTTHHFQNSPVHSLIIVYKVFTAYFLGFQASFGNVVSMPFLM